MPRGDGTGPFGQGPFTGRGGGYCIGNVTPGSAGVPVFGRCGGGRGHRNRFYATGVPYRATASGRSSFLGPEDEMELLISESDRMRSVLAGVERRMEQLKAK